MTTRYERIRCRIKGIGLVQMSTGATTRQQDTRRKALFYELVEAAQLDVIRALVDGRITWNELVDHHRLHGKFGATVLQGIDLERPLYEAIALVLPEKGQTRGADADRKPMGKSEAGRARYRVTRNRLQKLRPALTVADLQTLDWEQLQRDWGNSPSDWNNLGRFVAAFCTRYLGKRHALRDAVLEGFTRRHESPRVPDLSPALLHRIVAAAPLHAQASYMTLLLTGMRVREEYLRCDRSHLLPETHRVRVPAEGKTEASSETVAIEAADWPWIEAGIPSRLQYKWLRKYWNRACVAAGAATFDEPEEERGYHGPTMHSLRHTLAQWASDAGVDLSAVKAQLRHTNLSTTEAYARRSATRKVSQAVSTLLTRKTS